MCCKVEPMSIQLIMAVVFLGVGLVLDLVSFASPEWNDLGGEIWSLWKACAPDSKCISIDSRQVMSGVMHFGRACQVVGLLGYLFLTVLMTLFVVWKRDIRLLTVSIITAFVTLVALLFGAVMWGSGSNVSLSWGYYICFLSGLSASAVGGVLIYVRRQEFMQSFEKGGDKGVQIDDV